MNIPPFKLLFLEPDWGTPLAHVAVGSSMEMGNQYPGHETDVLLTHSCATYNELEWAIDQLHKELDKIKAQGRRKFDEHKAKQ